MNYEPNTKQWNSGEYVIHDADRKNAEMLMIVIGFTRDGLVKTRYVDQSKGRTVYKNELRFLLDPARFNIDLPLQAFEDPNNEGNSAKYHTGKLCIEAGCNNPAGTAWSPYWCFEHNVKRIKHIGDQLAKIKQSMETANP